MSQPPVTAVVGASGGLGASTLALAVGRRLAARAGPPVVVADLAPTSGGLEVTAGVEHLPGRRWPDLRDVRGRVPARRLAGTLPGEGGCHVLSASRRDGPGTDDAVVTEVLASLVDGGVPCVLDVPVASPLVAEVMARAPLVVLLVALRTRGLADAEVAVERLLASVPASALGEPDLCVVTRGGGRAGGDVLDDVAAHLGVRHLHHLRDDEGVARDAERGLFPGVSRDAVRRCADVVVAQMGLVETGGRSDRGAVPDPGRRSGSPRAAS